MLTVFKRGTIMKMTGGGHSYWKVVQVCASLKTSFFRPFFRSGVPPFQTPYQLQRLHLYFLRNFVFSRILTKFQLLRHIFLQNFIPETHLSSQKSVPETLFLKTWVVHTYQKLFENPPPPGHDYKISKAVHHEIHFQCEDFISCRTQCFTVCSLELNTLRV